MCNLYSNTTAADAMRGLFNVEPSMDYMGNAEPLSAIFPKYHAPVLRVSDGARELVRMHWGFLMPQTSKKTGLPILPRAVNNARDDKLQTSPFWRESFQSRRCLVPASSFCEAKGRNPATYYWFGLTSEEPDERPPFAFAGIWRHWKGNIKGELVEEDTYSIATTKPNDLVRTIHPDRMPVIVAPEDYETWLTGTAEAASKLLRPLPADQMRIVLKGESEKSDPLRN
ncbi:SOS response-associated peptidase [Litorivita sp. NS0012-18]|uniref:SOS response-associated peptidase n=1 Tax=Litorivita sp. NS0012-18 TaxID=3127655 RepID=UPI003109309E